MSGARLPDGARPDLGPRLAQRHQVGYHSQGRGAANDQQVYLMLQKLLADRIGVKVHKEKKEMAVYVLTVAKGGPKFKEADAEGPVTSTQEKGALSLKGVSLFELAAEF